LTQHGYVTVLNDSRMKGTSSSCLWSSPFTEQHVLFAVRSHHPR